MSSRRQREADSAACSAGGGGGESMGEFVGNQFVVGAARWTALGLTLVEPEPDHGRVVLLTCTQETG